MPGLSKANARDLNGGRAGLELWLRSMKSNSSLALLDLERLAKKRPEAEVGKGLRWQEKSGLEMRESQCLDTDLNFMRDLMGRRRRISFRRSSLPAIFSAEYDGGEEVDAAPLVVFLEDLVLLVDDILNNMGFGSFV